jgi:hypothetical protein
MIRRLLKAVRKMPRPPRSPGYRPLTKSCEGLTGACARLLSLGRRRKETARASHGPGRKARREEPGRSLSLYLASSRVTLRVNASGSVHSRNGNNGDAMS